MEVSGVVFRPTQAFSSTHCRNSCVSNAHCRKIGLVNLLGKTGEKFEGLKVSSGRGDGNVCCSSGFEDKGHLEYYVSAKSGGKKKETVKVKEGNKDEEATMKKKLKLLKGLSKDLLMLNEMGLVDVGDGLVQEKKQMIKEATNVLLAQLQQLKAERKDIKRKRKQEKAKLKALRVMQDDPSSSSSSESSDSEDEQVVNMKQMRNLAIAESKSNVLPTLTATEASPTSPSETQEVHNVSNQRSSILAEPKLNSVAMEIQALLNNPNPLSGEVIEDHSLPNSSQGCCTSNRNGNSNMESELGMTFEGRIDVCMGGKCKKMGAATLKEELERKVGAQGAVVGCKCLGKCRSAPNVRVSNGVGSKYVAEGADTSIKMPRNPLYIGVGLEDLEAIASYFLGEENNSGGFVVAS